MNDVEQITNEIVTMVAKHFPSFGRDSGPVNGNPLAAALADGTPSFAVGVPIDAVVTFIMLKLEVLGWNGEMAALRRMILNGWVEESVCMARLLASQAHQQDQYDGYWSVNSEETADL